MRATLMAMAAVTLLISSGCGGECTPVTPAASSKILGTFDCDQTASIDSCSGMSICQGSTTIVISRGDSGEWVLGKTDCNGFYYELEEQQVCAPPSERAGTYTVMGTRNVTDASADPHVTYTVNATVSETGGTNGAPLLSGTLTMTVMPSGGQACTLVGRLSGSCTDCVQ